jgi:uncharacterized OsmC-like protein
MTVAETERAAAAPAAGESRPTSTTVYATWRGERRYEIGRPGGPAVTIDAAGQQGLGPVDTMLGALAACAAIDGEGVDVAHTERAIALSFQSYCSISHSLAPDVRLESRLVLNGEPQPVVVQRGESAP